MVNDYCKARVMDVYYVYVRYFIYVENIDVDLKWNGWLCSIFDT